MKSNVAMFVVSILSILLTACGGGSGGSEEGGVKTLTYQKFATYSYADEGDTVRLSARIEGDGANSVDYLWEVSFDGQPLEFTGQGSNTISFIAPDVTVIGFVDVNVEFSLDGSSLIGTNNDRTTVRINDLDPIERQAQYGRTTVLPSVESLDFSQWVTGSTWRILQFESELASVNDLDFRINRSFQEIAELSLLQSGDGVSLSGCGTKSLRTLTPATISSISLCPVNESVVNLYQGDSAFRFEYSCDSEVVYAEEYTLISNETQTNFGSLSLDFEFREDLDTTEVCGKTRVSESLASADPTADPILTLSSIQLYTEYQGEPLQVMLDLEDDLSFGLSFFSEIFDENNFNSVTLGSDALPNLSGVEESNERGDLTLLSTNILNISGEFEANFTDAVGGSESLEAEFTLRFE